MPRRIMFFDTETTGSLGHPDLVSICWMLYDGRTRVHSEHHIIRPDGWTISPRSTRIHGIPHEHAMQVGKPLEDIVRKFVQDLRTCQLVVAHNIQFDRRPLKKAAKRLNMNAAEFWREPLEQFCTYRGICDQDNARKQPNEPRAPRDGVSRKLENVYLATFGEPMVNAHSADADTEALQRLFWARFGQLEDQGLPLRPAVHPPQRRVAPAKAPQAPAQAPAQVPAPHQAASGSGPRRRRGRPRKVPVQVPAPAPVQAPVRRQDGQQPVQAVDPVDALLSGMVGLRLVVPADDAPPLVLVSPRPSTTSVYHRINGCRLLNKSQQHTLMQAQAIHGRNDEPLRPCHRCWPQGLPQGIPQ